MITMIERLYQPDFSSIFGEKYANAFLYSQIDSLVWPIFKNMEISDHMQNLLNLKNVEGHEYFYHRKITVEDEEVELNCSNIDIALIQAMNLGRQYGISNSDVINAVKKKPKLFKGILSYDLSKNISQGDLISEIKDIEKDIQIAGIVLYPSYTKLDLTNDNNSSLKDLLVYCKNTNKFIKIDIGIIITKSKINFFFLCIKNHLYFF